MPLRTLLVALLVSLGFSSTAMAARGDAVLIDCRDHGTITGHYSQGDYAAALASLGADADEYSPCRAAITAARDRDLAAVARGAAGESTGARLAAGVTGQTTSGAGGTGSSALRAGSTAEPGRTAGSTSPRVTSPQAAPTSSSVPSDGSLAALALASGSGGDGPAAGGGHGLPVIPIVLALSVIAISAARALSIWGARPERLRSTPDAT